MMIPLFTLFEPRAELLFIRGYERTNTENSDLMRLVLDIVLVDRYLLTDSVLPSSLKP